MYNKLASACTVNIIFNVLNLDFYKDTDFITFGQVILYIKKVHVKFQVTTVRLSMFFDISLSLLCNSLVNLLGTRSTILRTMFGRIYIFIIWLVHIYMWNVKLPNIIIIRHIMVTLKLIKLPLSNLFIFRMSENHFSLPNDQTIKRKLFITHL